jgi:hypothetical protein
MDGAFTIDITALVGYCNLVDTLKQIGTKLLELRPASRWGRDNVGN